MKMFSKYMFGMLAGLAACLFSVSSVGQTYPFDSVRPIVTLQTEQAPDSQFLAVSMNYLGRKGQAVYASLDYLKNRGWFSGGAGKIPLEADTTFYVCNDTCRFKSFQEAISKAEEFTRIDTTNIDVSIIATRNNDGSKYSFSETVYVEGGDFEYITISSTDSIIYTGTTNAFHFAYGSTSPSIDGLKLLGQGSGNGVRVDYNNINIRNSYVDNFQNGYFLIRARGNLVSGDSIKNCSNSAIFASLCNQLFVRGFKARNCGKFLFSAGTSAVLQSLGLDSTITVDIQAIQNSHIYAIMDLDSVQIGEDDNQHPFSFVGAPIVERPNIPKNKFTSQGYILAWDEPYGFGEYSTAQEPAASSGIRYYFNTDENNLKITYDTTNWLTLGVLSALTQNSQAVEAAGNSLQINNVGLFRAGSDGNGTAPYEFSGSTFQAIPTVVEKDDPNGRAAIELQYGAFEAVDTSGSYVLERLAKPYLIQVDTLDFGNTADGSTNSVTVSVPGAEIGRAVTVNRNGPFVRPSHVYAYVSAADQVEVTFLNLSGSAIDPAAHPFTIAVSRYGP